MQALDQEEADEYDGVRSEHNNTKRQYELPKTSKIPPNAQENFEKTLQILNGGSPHSSHSAFRKDSRRVGGAEETNSDYVIEKTREFSFHKQRSR